MFWVEVKNLLVKCRFQIFFRALLLLITCSSIASGKSFRRNPPKVDESFVVAQHLLLAAPYFQGDYTRRPPETFAAFHLVLAARTKDLESIARGVRMYRELETVKLKGVFVEDGAMFELLMYLVFDNGRSFPFPFVLRPDETLGIDFRLPHPGITSYIPGGEPTIGIGDLARGGARKRRDLRAYQSALCLWSFSRQHKTEVSQKSSTGESKSEKWTSIAIIYPDDVSNAKNWLNLAGIKCSFGTSQQHKRCDPGINVDSECISAMPNPTCLPFSTQIRPTCGMNPCGF
jgi:hypothetical protein